MQDILEAEELAKEKGMPVHNILKWKCVGCEPVFYYRKHEDTVSQVWQWLC